MVFLAAVIGVLQWGGPRAPDGASSSPSTKAALQAEPDTADAAMPLDASSGSTSATAEVQPAKLTLQTRPWRVEVSLNERSAGRTPVWERDLPPGVHLLSLRRDGYAGIDTVIVLTAGESTRLQLSLRRRAPGVGGP